jgi:septal ring factor EnvC (AmiA/AmiB activator)
MRSARAWIVGVAALALCTAPAPVIAQSQDKIRAQRDTLDRIRRERETLERQANDLQNSVHDLDAEVTNLNQRADATARLVRALDDQLATISGEADAASREVTNAESELNAKRHALHTRLIDIYKRGPLFTTQVMLSARSFGELVARYKYLHLLALHDRSLVTRVEQLRDRVTHEQSRLIGLRAALELNRSDKAREEAQLRALEEERGATLARTRAQARATEDRLLRLKATEAQFTNLIANLDAERRRAETARPSSALSTSTIHTSDYGRLDWPVSGPLVYTFGKAQTANNTTIRWNGVGIRAAVGTNVAAVAPGRVVNVGQLGTYGLTVIIDHGGGDYSIYGSLDRAGVRAQQTVAKGQVIGEVGVSDPELPPHLHFEIRHGGADGRPASVDPAAWLRETGERK